jgi:non-ribosomal peptide synthetase component F
VIVIGGEALRASELQRLGPTARLYNIYGPTEISVVSSVGIMTRLDSVVHVGEPISNICYNVVNPQSLVPLPFGCTGELLISGVGVAAGYW